MRNVSSTAYATLTNTDAIAVNQDPLGQMGLRLDNSSSAPTQTWCVSSHATQFTTRGRT